MCFSPRVSFSLFVFGAIMTAVSYRTPLLRKRYVHVLLGFYTVMELLQTVQYLFVNNCNEYNRFFTNIAYVLVIVQPLMWNTVFYTQVQPQYKPIFKLAMVMSALWIAMNVYSRISYKPSTAKNECGFFNHDKTCTYRDKKGSHLYWRWTTAHWGDMSANYFMYMCLWFVPALLVPGTRATSVVLAAGALFAYTITRMYGSTVQEFPSVWCLMSIPLFLLSIYEAFRSLFSQ